MRTQSLTAVALATFALCHQASAQTQPATPTELNKVTVTGEGDKLGTGLMMDEDAPKARSSVTKAQLEKTRSSGNPFQALTLLPGVNSTSYDATGLFGGNLRVRGFNSDQMGFTVNGAPVNDSGSFTVFPQEYIDQENICSLYVTQGAADVDAPHVGASGGNVGIFSCAPEDTQRVRVAGSLGQLSFYRLFARVDSGKIGPFKGFVSYSKTEADKWKGFGKANREHVDAGGEWDFGQGNKITANALINHAVNNNFLALPLYYTGTATTQPPTFQNRGYYADYTNTIPQHVTPVNGTAQVDANPNPAYAGYSLNPFDDAVLTVKGSFALSDRLRLDVQPYYWYGYGTGGTQQTTLTESNSGSVLHGGIADINGDGDTRDTVLVYRSSVTDTNRPGIISSLTYSLDSQKINGGFWFERARHRQTQPATHVDNAGGISSLWLNDTSNELLYNDGNVYQGRNWNTISTAGSVFLQDAVELLDSRLTVTPGISYRRIKRDFTNIANSGTTTLNGVSTNTGGVDYKITDTYGKPLPTLGISFQATPGLQVYADAQRSFRVPSNFEFGLLGRGITFTNGVGTATGITDLGVVPETSWNFDLGSRLKTPYGNVSGAVYYNLFKNRIASSFNSFDQTTLDTNVGDSTTKGVELEFGTVPFYGFSGYVSGSYTRSTIKNNSISRLVNPATGVPCSTMSATCVLLPYSIAGAQFPDTPKGMAALALQYANGPFLVEISGKYTSFRATTLTNDSGLAGYTLWDLNAAYKLPNAPGNSFKNPVIRLNVSNIFSRKYYLANSGSGSNIQPDAYGNPTVYSGAPRFASVTFQVDY